MRYFIPQNEIRVAMEIEVSCMLTHHFTEITTYIVSGIFITRRNKISMR